MELFLQVSFINLLHEIYIEWALLSEKSNILKI